MSSSSASSLFREAESLLKTSLFQWTPDYLSAGPKFEAAAQQLRASGQVNEALVAYTRAAECHVKPGASGWDSAVRAFEQAEKLLVSVNRGNEAGDFGIKAAELLQENGAGDRAMDALARAALEKETAGNPTVGMELLIRAAGLIQVGSGSETRYVVRGSDVCRLLVNRLVKGGRFGEAVEFAKKGRELQKSVRQMSSVYKQTLVIVILQLARGDVAAAQKEMQEAFNDDAFLRTDEAAAVEDLVKAFAATDSEGVAKAAAMRVVGTIEREVAYLARQLDPLKRLSESRPAAATVLPQKLPTTTTTSTKKSDLLTKSDLFTTKPKPTPEISNSNSLETTSVSTVPPSGVITTPVVEANITPFDDVPDLR